MKIYIKYMVSLRCKMMVKDALRELGLHYVIVELGMVDLMEDITSEQHNLLKNKLFQSGLELLDDKKTILIEKIKNVINLDTNVTIKLDFINPESAEKYIEKG